MKTQTRVLTTMFPDVRKKDIKVFLEGIVERDIINPEATIYNNYIHKKIDVNLLNVIDWYEDTKPIGAGFGVFFKNQENTINPAATMLWNFLKLRKSYKGKLHLYKEGTYEYKTLDRYQLTEKINANSYYGASGAPTSNFFNIFTATSVTATGQSLISTTQQAFEMFMTNSVQLIDLDECFVYLENIRNESYDMDARVILPNVSVEKLMEHLKDMFKEWKDDYQEPLFFYLMNIDQITMNRMYFKNNLYEFSSLKVIRTILTNILRNTKEFKDPGKLPKETEKDIKKLWDYYSEFVHYNYFTFNRIQRLKKDKRKNVVVVDTDSNMLNLNPWVEFIYDNVVAVNPDIENRDVDTVRYISVNTMCYALTAMITDVLAKYTKESNIPKEFRHLINMKNEFLFTRLILSRKKKRYVSSIRLREGHEIIPEKIDIKGMDFIKSSTREETKDFFTKLLKDRVLYTDHIDIPQILRDLEAFERGVTDSLLAGEKNFLIPNSVKELEAYKDPYREQGVRSVIAWNAMYPDQEIQLPEKVDIVNVKMERAQDIEALKESYPEMYKRLMKGIYESKNPSIAKKGVSVVAIPRNVESIPEWLVPYIDVVKIATSNVSRFYSVIHSLEVETIKSTKRNYFTNILNI